MQSPGTALGPVQSAGGLRGLTEEDYAGNAAAPISSAFSGVIARSPARTQTGLFTLLPHEQRKRDCQPLLDIQRREATKSHSHCAFKLFLLGLAILAACS